MVCPPQVRSGEQTDRLIGEFELLLGAVPVGLSRLIPVAFVLFDQSARLYPPARGRRFARLGDRQAAAYVQAVLASRGGPALLVQRLKGLVVLCYYELPEVQEQLGYRPAPYIAAVSRRRLDSYGPQVRAGESAVLAADPPDHPEPDHPEPDHPEEAQ